MSVDHPEDVAVRRRLAASLRRIREGKRLTQPDLADVLGVTESAVSDMEGRGTWRVLSVAGWARALEHRLCLSLDGLTVPDDGDALAAVYAAQQPTTAEAEDLLLLRSTVNDLARVRAARGLRLAGLGRLLGVSESAAWRWENVPDRRRVLSLQRHVRVLGGCLGVWVEPVRAGVPA